MLDKWLGNQEGKDQYDQEYQRALNTLYHQVQSVITNVDLIIGSLAPDYPKEALLRLSRHFERISREFTSYTIATNNMHYEVVNRSRLRKMAAKAVASKARNVAKLFEKYARKPSSYSLVHSRLEIYKLRDVLENLLSRCL